MPERFRSVPNKEVRFTVMDEKGKKQGKFTKEKAMRIARQQDGTSYILEDYQNSQRVVATMP